MEEQKTVAVIPTPGASCEEDMAAPACRLRGKGLRVSSSRLILGAALCHRLKPRGKAVVGVRSEKLGETKNAKTE